MNILEMMMLICFGCAWPASIYKSVKSRSTGGKTPVFHIIMSMGYLFGIANKLFRGADYVLIFYCLNLAMVITDFVLYFRNRKYERSMMPIDK